MQKSALLASAATLLVASQSVNAAENYQYQCSGHQQNRVISVKYLAQPEAIPCQVRYRKGNEDKLLWQAKKGAGFCEEKAKAFMQKQQGWGFKCKKQMAGAAAEAETKDSMKASTANKIATGTKKVETELNSKAKSVQANVEEKANKVVKQLEQEKDSTASKGKEKAKQAEKKAAKVVKQLEQEKDSTAAKGKEEAKQAEKKVNKVVKQLEQEKNSTAAKSKEKAKQAEKKVENQVAAESDKAKTMEEKATEAGK